MQRRMNYSSEPRWIRARYAGRCSCGQRVQPGDNAYYYPEEKRLKCRACGREAELKITADDIRRALRLR